MLHFNVVPVSFSVQKNTRRSFIVVKKKRLFPFFRPPHRCLSPGHSLGTLDVRKQKIIRDFQKIREVRNQRQVPFFFETAARATLLGMKENTEIVGNLETYFRNRQLLPLFSVSFNTPGLEYLTFSQAPCSGTKKGT